MPSTKQESYTRASRTVRIPDGVTEADCIIKKGGIYGFDDISLPIILRKEHIHETFEYILFANILFSFLIIGVVTGL